MMRLMITWILVIVGVNGFGRYSVITRVVFLTQMMIGTVWFVACVCYYCSKVFCNESSLYPKGKP